MQRKNEGKNSTQSKIKAIRELRKSILGKQFLVNTPKPAEPTFETNCVTESSKSPRRAHPVPKTDLRKSSKGVEYLTEPTGDFSYSRNYKAKKMTKNPSTDLTNSIFQENKRQILRLDIKNISEPTPPTHTLQTSRLPTQNPSSKELRSSPTSPRPASPFQPSRTTANPTCPTLSDSIVTPSNPIPKNKPRPKQLTHKIQSSFSKPRPQPSKKPQPKPVPNTESLIKVLSRVNPDPVNCLRMLKGQRVEEDD
jgi:hypothetical protein